MIRIFCPLHFWLLWRVQSNYTWCRTACRTSSWRRCIRATGGRGGTTETEGTGIHLPWHDTWPEWPSGIPESARNPAITDRLRSTEQFPIPEQSESFRPPPSSDLADTPRKESTADPSADEGWNPCIRTPRSKCSRTDPCALENFLKFQIKSLMFQHHTKT